MRVIAALFGPYAPDALPSHVSVFSHDFKRFERLTKLATSSLVAIFGGLSLRRKHTAIKDQVLMPYIRRRSAIVERL